MKTPKLIQKLINSEAGEVSAPPAVAPPAPTADEVQTRIEKLKADHDAAMVAAEERFKSAWADLVLQHRAAEDAAARAVEAEVPVRLTAAVGVLTAPDNAGKESAERDDEAKRVALRARVAPALANAQRVKNALIAFEIEFGATLQVLKRLSTEELLRGMPMGDAGEKSVNLVRTLLNTVEDTLNLHDNAKRNVEARIPGITALVEHGWQKYGRQEFENVLVQELYELAMANDEVIRLLRSRMAFIARVSEEINARRAEYAGTTEAAEPMQFENRGAIVEGLKEAARLTREGDGLPGQADIGYSPYGDR